jgi:hypothetical protein
LTPSLLYIIIRRWLQKQNNGGIKMKKLFNKESMSRLTRQILTENQLLDILYENVQQVREHAIAILAGHFPLRVNSTSLKLEENFGTWGCFSQYTLELAVKVAGIVKRAGKKIGFVFLCDDHSYRDLDKILLTSRAMTDSQLDNRWRSERDRLFKSRSGETAELPPLYAYIMDQGGFTTTDVIRHNHQKAGRQNCLYFSESILRDPRRTTQSENSGFVHACTREYLTLIESKQLLIRDLRPYLVSFIPQRCSHFICDAVDFFFKDFRGAHIFMETRDDLDRKSVYETQTRVWYKRNA